MAIVSGRVLVGLDRSAGGDLADDRQDASVAGRRLRHELAGQAEADRRGRRQADGARLGGAALQVALALEDLEVVVDGGRGGEPDRPGDLADRRRIAAGAQRRRDEVEDLDLALGVVLRHSRLLARA